MQYFKSFPAPLLRSRACDGGQIWIVVSRSRCSVKFFYIWYRQAKIGLSRFPIFLITRIACIEMLKIMTIFSENYNFTFRDSNWSISYLFLVYSDIWKYIQPGSLTRITTNVCDHIFSEFLKTLIIPPHSSFAYIIAIYNVDSFSAIETL